MNKKHIKETLLHRMVILFQLAEDFSKHAVLLPELLIKTLRDTHRFTNQGHSHLNSIEIMDKFQISYSEEEKELLQKIENSLRKEKDYHQLSNAYSKDLLLSLSKKIQYYINTL